MVTQKDYEFMRMALEQAKIAGEMGEVPIGAVVVKDGEVISTGYNLREINKNSLCHAELIAIDKACEKLGGWNCTLPWNRAPCARGRSSIPGFEELFSAHLTPKPGAAAL